nr:hypothetical protein KPHV_32540 [Kitasatospora purpeofusca]
MTRATRYAIPAVVLSFFLVPLGLFALRAVLVGPAPPSPVGRWVGQGADGTLLELAENGRLGPSVIPAAACLEPAEAMRADDRLEVADGTWTAGYEPDAGYLVTVSFDTPRPCRLTLASERHWLAVSMRTDHRTWWTLVRP